MLAQQNKFSVRQDHQKCLLQHKFISPFCIQCCILIIQDFFLFVLPHTSYNDIGFYRIPSIHLLDINYCPLNFLFFSMTFLVVNSQEVKTTSQDASGGSFITGLDHLFVYRVSNVSFPFVFVPCSKARFCMGSNMAKEFIYILSMLSFLHIFPLASSRNTPLQWLVIQLLLTTSKKVGKWGA